MFIISNIILSSVESLLWDREIVHFSQWCPMKRFLPELFEVVAMLTITTIAIESWNWQLKF